MEEIPKDFRPFADRVVFPRSVDELVSSSLCPACQSKLTSPTLCPVCFLDLLNPATAQLSSLATDIAALLDHRLDVIGRIRWESAHIAAAAEEADVAASESAATSRIPVPAASPASASAPLAVAAVPAEPRRSSVQVALLVVGISLLSIAAIFFLVYAFITFGLVARSLIVGGITIASIVTATMLRRRGLPNTAEGVSVFAIVLIYLDVWALRANDFFGLGSGSGVSYWGWAFVITAVLLVAWGRASTLRAPTIIGFTVFPIGFGLLIGSWATQADGVFVTFTSIALAGIVHRLAPRPARVERAISFTTTTVALIVATISAFWAFPHATAGAAIAFIVIAAVAAINVVAINVRVGEPVSAGTTVSGALFSAAAGALTAAVFAVATLRFHDQMFVVIAPSVAAALVALTIEATISKASTPLARLHLRVASISSAIVAGVALLIPLAILVIITLETLGRGLSASWTLGAGSRIVHTPVDLAGASGTNSAVIALGLVIAFTAAIWAVRGVARPRFPVLAWAVAIGVLVIAPVAQILWIVLVIWLLLAAIAVAVLIRIPSAPRAPLLVVAFGAGALAYWTSWASEDTWAITSVVVICLALLMRLVFRSTEVKASFLGLALVLAIVGAGATAQNLSLSFHPELLAEAINITRATGFVAILLLGIAALVPSKKITGIDRRVTFWITGFTVLSSTLVSQFSLHSLPGRFSTGLLLPEFITGFVVSLFLLVALAVWLFGGVVRAFEPERTTVAVLIAPGIAFAVDALAGALPAISLPPQTTLVIAAAVSAALSLALTSSRRVVVNRIAMDLGIVIVGVPGVIAALVAPGALTWLVLEVAAIGALLIACSRDGLFGSGSSRKHVGWLALALATGGLWWWLANERIEAVEPWVLPLSGLLLLIALFTWISGRRLSPPSFGAAPLITLAALVTSVVPLALVPSIGAETRPIIVGALSAAMLLVGAILSTRFSASPETRHEAEPFVRVLALAGWIGVVLIVFVQALIVGRAPVPDFRLDLWVGSAFIVLVVASLIVVRSLSASRVSSIAAEALVFTALVELIVLESARMNSSSYGFVRALVVILIFGAAHVAGIVGRRAPFTSRVGWSSIGLAAIVGIIALSVGAFRDVEWVSVPVGLALLAGGTVQLRRVASRTSWPWLAPGAAVLLAPSLITTAWDPTVWRLVALGVVCVALIVSSVILKLQSPFILASIVVLIHAIATFSPQIAAVYQTVEWWVWLAIGGIIIVVVSVRFEKSRDGVKRVVHSIGGLR